MPKMAMVMGEMSDRASLSGKKLNVKGVSVGDTVKVTITGKVSRVSADDMGNNVEIKPSSMNISGAPKNMKEADDKAWEKMNIKEEDEEAE